MKRIISLAHLARLEVAALLLLLVLGMFAASSLAATKITVMLWGGTDEAKVWNQIVQLFEKANPGYTVDLQMFPDYDYKFKIRLAAGDPPDAALRTGGSGVSEFAERGSLLPLDSFIKRDGVDLGVYFPASMKGFQYKGATYGLPIETGTYVIYYNEELFSKEGLKTPAEYAKEGKWNWQTLLDLARKLTKDTNGDGRPEVFGFASNSPNVLWDTHVWSEGGMQVDNLEYATESRWNTPEVIQAIQFVYDLEHRYKVSPPYALSQALGGNDEMFKAGRVAMYYTGAWGRMVFAHTPFSWNIAPPPAGKTKAAYGYSTGWVIPKGSRHPEGAWRWVKFCGSPQAVEAYAEMGVSVPPIRKLALSKSFLNPGGHVNNRVFLDTLQYARVIQFYDYPAYMDIVNKGFTLIINGQMSVKDGTAYIHKQLQSLFAGK